MPEAEPHILPAASTTITLPVERLEQLRSIADKRKITLARLIEDVIDEAIVNGEIPDELPGFGAFMDENVLVVTIRGFTLPMIERALAPGLAHVLEAASGMKDFEISAGVSIPVGRAVRVALRDGDVVHEINVGRHGRGVAFSFRDNRTGQVTKTTFSPGIALSLAQMIRRAVSTH